MIDKPTTPADAADSQHGTEPASLWVQRWSHLVPADGIVLDVACGYGRHALWFYRQKHPLALIDRAQAAIDSIANQLPANVFEAVEAVVADIENGPWPFPGRQFAGVVVTNYLWRPLLPTLIASVAPGGVLIYETFADGNETIGKPSRPDFLLRPGELLAVCQSLRIVAFENGFVAGDAQHAPRFVQRIVAVNETIGASPAATAASQSPPPPARYLL